MTSLDTAWFTYQGLPATVGLAAVATIGYLVGRMQRSKAALNVAPKSEELRRAIEIAQNLEAVVETLRRDLATHYSQVERFKQEVHEATQLSDDDEAWRQLRGEADRVLTPTLRLAGQVASAYDQIRRQSQAISNFSGGRTDTLTGLSNRRALDEVLEMELSGHEASQGVFCIAVLSIGPSPDLPKDSRREQKERMILTAEMLKSELRDRDLAARYGTDEFVVMMPHTRIYGSCSLGRRLRESLTEQGAMSVSIGIAQSRAGDTTKSLLARADSALYSARAEGEGLIYVHTGQLVRADSEADKGEKQAQPKKEVATLKLVDSAAE